jgi:hypothetical protein
MANLTLYGILKGVDTGLGVLYNFGNLGSACVTGFMAIPTVLAQYQAFLTNPVIL